MNAQRATLSQGRQHFAHGPIDLVIGAEGEAPAVHAAHEAAWARFATVLPELVAELALLRAPVHGACALQGPIARRMWQACAPFSAGFITPMAAVAGAVAQEIAAFYARPGITRAWVNNGGDIALHLAPGAQVRVGLVVDPDPARQAAAAALDGRFTVQHALPVRGIATSGWRGRSFSLGIADSVTVLAATAAQADAAATVIANAVNVQDPRIERRAACEIKDDSDLGTRLVTVHVPPLSAPQVRAALAAGLACAHDLRARGLVHAAALVCQGQLATTLAAANEDQKEAGEQRPLHGLASDAASQCNHVVRDLLREMNVRAAVAGA